MKYALSGIFAIFLFSASVFAEEFSGNESNEYARKKELLTLYEKTLQQSAHRSHFDFFAGLSGVSSSSPYPTFSGGLVFRPFASKYYLSNNLTRLNYMYSETKKQTSLSLSEDAEEKMDRIYQSVIRYRKRPYWERVVVVGGYLAPLSVPDAEYQDPSWFAAAGIEPIENILLTAGATLEDEPQFVVSVSVAFFSGFYSAGYSFMERMESAATTRRIYEYE